MNHVDNPFQSPSILSICTGMRGLERGIERVIGPFGAVTYVEIEAFVVYNLVRQMEQGLLDPAPVWTNLKTFDPRPFHGKIHGIIGGYPCQPFSLAGKLEGINDPRHLWPFIERIIHICRPVWCFFENVANHLNLGYREVRQSLESMGYTVKEGIYTAEEVGAPHKRERLFILAILGNANNYGCVRPEVFKSVGKRNDYNETGQNLVCKFKGSGDARANETMDDPQRKGLERQPGNVNAAGWRPGGENGPVATSGFPVHRWPAGQGEYQHGWEEPRTIEPGVGFTAHGYDFTTDLLRLAGNGVVEQTAELAFTELLKKHIVE